MQCRIRATLKQVAILVWGLNLQRPKLSKVQKLINLKIRQIMTIYGALVPKCFELFRRKNIQNFPGLCPWTPWEGLITPPPSRPLYWFSITPHPLTPSILVFCDPPLPSDSPAAPVFLLTTLVKKLAPPKNCWI